MRELALFAGAGGGILGGILLGWRTVCAVELDAYCRNVLLARQRDGHLPKFPIWDDVCTFDGLQWRGHVDVISGGFPCQDISCAGRGAGIDGARSGLWREMARIIGEVRPRYAFVENSPALVVRGLGTVLGDLAALGYDARWGVLGAHHVGAPHKRDRIWIVANADSTGCQREGPAQPKGWDGAPEPARAGADVPDSDHPGLRQLPGRERREGCTAQPAEPHDHGAAESVADTDCAPRGWRRDPIGSPGSRADAIRAVEPGGRSSIEPGTWWAVEPNVGRVAHGVSSRVDRLRAIGNGQVPSVARLAWETLSHGHRDHK